jgi:beta-galactosidase
MVGKKLFLIVEDIQMIKQVVSNDRIHKILYGGDYNPEQWPEEVWEEDMRLFHLAHIDVVTLNVFSWASLQRDDDVWDFTQLDKIIRLAVEHDLNICLATSTGAHPAWMARKYPEILRVDEHGIRRKFGSRHNSCPNSPIYRKFSAELAGKLSERYGSCKNIIAWHISNEYGGMCYCETCERAFRGWLQKKYGTLEALNRAWNTAFWGHTFYDWEEIVVPDQRSEEFYTGDGRLKTNFQGISLDYRRFMSDSMQECYRLEYDAVKQAAPDIPVTTNLMGTYSGLDYQRWAPDLDFISWDNYPSYDAMPWEPAFQHDLMRGLKQGMSFALMEQTPSVSNWHPYCALKRPGEMRLISYQAAAHGADTIMFFQMRQSIGACEKLHGALIGHRGNEHTRVFSEMAALGRELEQLGDATLGARTTARAAIVFDWDNWWATQLSAGPTLLLDYLKEVKTWYRYFWEKNIPVDVISVTDDLTPYQVVAAPMLYMCKEGFDQKLSRWVADGGCFLGSYFSGYADENDLFYTGGYPGTLKELLGIWVEEADALVPDAPVTFSYGGNTYRAGILCDLIHLEGAVSLGSYNDEFYAGMPAVTRNAWGKGCAYYAATHSDPEFYRAFLDDVCREQGLCAIADSPAYVEVTLRSTASDDYYFVLNHGTENSSCRIPAAVRDLLSGDTWAADAPIAIAAKDVRILHKI